jgi:hypothetical protein
VVAAAVEDRVLGVLVHPGRRVGTPESRYERAFSVADLGFVEVHFTRHVITGSHAGRSRRA